MKNKLLYALCALLTALALILPVSAATADELADIIIKDMFKVQVWIDPSEKPEVTDYAYSFVAVGDTQIICESYPQHMTTLYDWILNNVEAKKIAYVFGLGDITNHTTTAEWQVAKREIERLNGVVPYSLVRGNHDKSNAYNKMLATEAYMSQFEGSYQEDRIDNTWRTFTVANVDYLFVNLDYGASDAILNWAGEIIAAHPHHRVIISTHAYMYRNGARITATNTTATPNPKNLTDGSVNHGQQMWDKLFSRHENIFMVLSVHISTESVELSVAKGIHGNTVYQFLIDPQGLDATTGPMGMVAILYFSEDGQKVTVEQYSTVQQKYFLSTSQYSFKIPAYDPHSFTAFTSDGNATCLSDGTETAKCDGCEKTLTRTVEGSKTEDHVYVDGVCSVCAASAPQTEPPVTEAPLLPPQTDPAPTDPAEQDGLDTAEIVLLAASALIAAGGIAAVCVTLKRRRG